MQKLYCDGCEKEITDRNQYHGQINIDLRLKTPNSRFGSVKNEEAAIQLVRVDNQNRLDICKYCIFDAIDRADDRPRVG